MDKVFSHLSIDFPNAHFHRVEAEEQPEISEEYSVSIVPLFVFFKILPVSQTKSPTKIPMDDPHVRCIIKACQETYVQSSSMTKTKKLKLKNKT